MPRAKVIRHKEGAKATYMVCKYAHGNKLSYNPLSGINNAYEICTMLIDKIKKRKKRGATKIYCDGGVILEKIAKEIV